MPEHLRVRNLIQDSRRQCVFVVALKHWHGFLNDDCAVIEFLIDKVHGASSHLHAIGECLLLSLEPGKSRQE